MTSQCNAMPMHNAMMVKKDEEMQKKFFNDDSTIVLEVMGMV